MGDNSEAEDMALDEVVRVHNVLEMLQCSIHDLTLAVSSNDVELMTQSVGQSLLRQLDAKEAIIDLLLNNQCPDFVHRSFELVHNSISNLRRSLSCNQMMLKDAMANSIKDQLKAERILTEYLLDLKMSDQASIQNSEEAAMGSIVSGNFEPMTRSSRKRSAAIPIIDPRNDREINLETELQETQRSNSESVEGMPFSINDDSAKFFHVTTVNRKYDQNVLLYLRNSSLSLQKPENLPSVEIIRENPIQGFFPKFRYPPNYVKSSARKEDILAKKMIAANHSSSEENAEESL